MSDAKLPPEPTLTKGELFSLGAGLLTDTRYCRACDGDGYIGNRDCGGCKGAGEVFACSGPTRQFVEEALARLTLNESQTAQAPKQEVDEVPK